MSIDRKDMLEVSAAMSVDALLAEVRRLAIIALDSGLPVAAANLANAADRIEAQGWHGRPPFHPAGSLTVRPPLV